MGRILLIAALFMTLPTLGAAERLNCARGKTLAPSSARSQSEPAIVIAEASCASLCRQRHNQCRIATKGAPRCDADLQRCLKGCIATQRR